MRGRGRIKKSLKVSVVCEARMRQTHCREVGKTLCHGCYSHLDVWELQANGILQCALSGTADLSSFPTGIRIMARRHREDLNEVAWCFIKPCDLGHHSFNLINSQAEPSPFQINVMFTPLCIFMKVQSLARKTTTQSDSQVKPPSLNNDRR